MPDILIRGISIPRNCFECPLFTNCDACEGHECGCGLLGGIGYEEDISEDRRRDDCPLHELPEHGDLIDRDAALSHPFANGQYDRENANRHFIGGHESYKEWLEDLPVIVPASEEVADENP